MIKSSKLAWFVVSDIKKAKEFYVDKLGLVLKEEAVEYGWIEVAPSDESYRLGISEYSEEFKGEEPGSGAVITFNVDNLDEAMKIYKEKGVSFIGEVQEIPGYIKTISFLDADMNKFQLCQYLYDQDSSSEEGCCESDCCC